jgi:glycosyltransferase involved in cell wall biosynthesis
MRVGVTALMIAPCAAERHYHPCQSVIAWDVRVSVLLPVRNAALWLGECLRSLAQQSLADHEIVAVDDGSTDGSSALLDAAAARDPRLRVIHTPPLGLVPALNRAAALARSDYLARMDADDVAHPQRIERLWRALNDDPGLDILASRVALVGHLERSNAGLRAYVEWTNGLLEHAAMAHERFVDAPLVHPSVMLRRSALERLGGYREFDGPEDYDLWLNALEQGCRIGKLAEPLLNWRDSAQRLTRSDGRYAADRFVALKLTYLLRGPLAGNRPIVVWGAGPIGKRWSRLLREAGRCVAAHIDVDPRKIGQRVHATPVVGIDAVRTLPGSLHLAAVGQRGARARMRAAAEQLGLVAGEDWWPVA